MPVNGAPEATIAALVITGNPVAARVVWLRLRVSFYPDYSFDKPVLRSTNARYRAGTGLVANNPACLRIETPKASCDRRG
jgi:hypothetical protein